MTAAPGGIEPPVEPGTGPPPQVASTRAELAEALCWLRARDGPDRARRVALVPTMGALHAGHSALMRLARRHADVVVVSVFVNPMQFSPHEDLDRYPRSWEADVARCAREGVELIFAPTVEQMYPDGEPQVAVDPGRSAELLEGASRPGHFRGVLTVVAKLFGLVRPDVAVFGEKDYQQLVLVRRMVVDLALDVEVVAAPTVRDTDGLALSSRNRYLSEADRRIATRLAAALSAAAAARGAAADVLAAAEAVLAAERRLGVDYLELRGPELGTPPDRGPARLLVAATVGSTRLIDNIAVDLDPDGTQPGPENLS